MNKLNFTNMRKILFFTITALLLASCGGPPRERPDDTLNVTAPLIGSVM
jgi:hypothetical protein